MDSHISAVAWIHIILSAILLLFIGGFLVLMIGGGIASGDGEAMAITGTLGVILACFFGLFALPGIAGGFGLLQRKPWARLLVMVLGGLNILNFPIGTAIGAYTLWVLLQDETAQIFEGRAEDDFYLG